MPPLPATAAASPGTAPPPASLAALEARLAQDLKWLALPAPAWSPRRTHRGAAVSDVLIVGAGMCGLAAAGALQLLGVDNLRIVDRAPAGTEGPWVTFARMETLRSPKELTGPALGLPSLTFRAWFEAQFGEAAWAALDKIPRAQWMDYLIWYRRVLGLAVENGIHVVRVRPLDGLLEVTLANARGEEQQAWARHVVLATGRDGGGQPQVPAIARQLTRERWAHSADAIDFAALAGRRVAVVGAGASAMDNAAAALEAGAARVDLFVRRRDLPRINKLTGVSSPGFAHGFASLSDDWKWRINHYAMRSQTPPPRGSTLRVSRHANAYFHLGSPIETIVDGASHLLVKTPRGEYPVDFLIFGTGFRTDLRARGELAPVVDAIRLWKDVFDAPQDGENGELAHSPYLGAAFECLEKVPGSCPGLEGIHLFNYSALASQGKLSGDIPAVSIGAQRMAQGIVASLFREDREHHYAALQAFAKPELFGDEWTDADAPAGMAAMAASAIPAVPAVPQPSPASDAPDAPIERSIDLRAAGRGE
ncbi:MAG: NAD(P)-binding domain-containing protein [Janthinobacterium lividum]